MPEENEPNNSENYNIEQRKVFSSPQERTDLNCASPFSRPARQQNLSQCFLLGPQNLTKIFDNKHIVDNSGTLFGQTGYLNSEKYMKNKNKSQKFILASYDKKEEREVDDVLNDLYYESTKLDSDEGVVVSLLDELYECMENSNLLSGKVNSKLKIQILKSLYKFVEFQNENLLLNIARIILAVSCFRINLQIIFYTVFLIVESDWE